MAVTVAGHLSIEELEDRYRSATETVAKSHLQTIWLLAKGRSIGDVAEILGFVPRWVELLVSRYNKAGPEALGDQRRGNGRTATLLTDEVLMALADRLREPPDDGGLWTGPKVAAWIAARLGLEKVHPQRGWDALKKLEWSIQVPRPRHPRAATEAEHETLKKTSPLRSPKPPSNIPTNRSKSGQPTNTGSD
ncbi:MAG: winged helix-turn-helix domain-containing protein [Alphaproteobacteria bacterium]|nr:winged helix-turn-helix domain-containing protein [Alphaproteobacteria bacterium]